MRLNPSKDRDRSQPKDASRQMVPSPPLRAVKRARLPITGKATFYRKVAFPLEGTAWVSRYAGNQVPQRVFRSLLYCSVTNGLSLPNVCQDTARGWAHRHRP
jgi:hypothetical protein